MTAHLTGTLLCAECNRILGLSTLQAEFEQNGRAYTRSRIVALGTFGTRDEDWERCLTLYRSLHNGQRYSLSGDTLAAQDGTVLLLGCFSIRPLGLLSPRAAAGHTRQEDISA